jgi:senataxin
LIDINTVDGFQGQEKDIIILSCVRSSTGGGVGFLSDRRRINVALTRARYSLLVVGDDSTLKADGTWGALIDHARARQACQQLHLTDLKPRNSSSGNVFSNLFRAGAKALDRSRNLETRE